MKINYISFFIFFFISGCLTQKNKESTLMGTWRLYDLEQLKNSSNKTDAFSEDAQLKKPLKDGEVLCFFQNGNYSEIKGDGNFNAGNWELSEDKNSILFKDSGRIRSLAIIKIDKNSNNKELLSLTFDRKNLTFKFIKESESLKNFLDDPFYQSNNKWRSKPKEPENATQLIDRLNNYVKHFALILKSAKVRKQNIVSFEFSKGPIRIYNGGIGIYPYCIIPEYWKNSFYDEADASTAYLKYEEYLKRNSYKGGGIGDWIEDDYNILISIYAGIEQSNER